MAANDKSSKRQRLGNRVQRGIWKGAHAWKHPWYESLSRRAWMLNNKGSTPAKQEAKLDRTLQARIWADQQRQDTQARAMYGR